MNKFFNIISIILFSLSIFTTTHAQQYWTQTQTPATSLLRSVCFLDSLTGWAAGDSGAIIHTSDGGKNWVLQDSKTDKKIVDIFFLNKNVGWALAWSETVPFGTIILKTENGGKDWTSEVYPPGSKFMQTIIFLDSLNGWMGGFPGELVHTTDGGVEWNEANIDSGALSGFPVRNFGFYNRQHAYAVGGQFDLAGVIWRTTNAGQSWAATGVGPEPIQQLVIFDSLNALGVGGDFEYGTAAVRTTDGGENWNYRSLIIYGVAYTVSFRTPLDGWAALGFAEKFIHTTDGGETWEEIPTPDRRAILDLAFTDSLHGYAVADSGIMLKYNNPSVGIKSDYPNQLPVTFRLLQNYPNPFNPETIIAFAIPHTSLVTLKVYDVLGREVATLLNEQKPAGQYRLRFDGQDLPSGVYYYTLTAQSASQSDRRFQETRKMLLVR